MAERAVGIAPSGEHAKGICKELLTMGVPFRCTPYSDDVMNDSRWAVSVYAHHEDVLEVAMSENGLNRDGSGWD